MFTHKQIHDEAERAVRLWGKPLPSSELVLSVLYGLQVPHHEWEEMHKRVHHYLTQSHKRRGKWRIKHGGIRLRHHGKKP